MVARLQKTIEALGDTADGIFAVDSEHLISYWSPAVERILGYPASAVLGKPCYEVVQGMGEDGGVWCQRNCPVMRRIRDGSVPPSYDIQTKRANGQEAWLNVSILLAPQGRRLPRVPLHLVRDVTERKTRERLASKVMDLVSQTNGAATSLTVSMEEASPVLAPREWEALSFLSEGLPTAVVAERMGIREVTVKNYVQRMLTKLGAHSRAEAIAWFYRRRAPRR